MIEDDEVVIVTVSNRRVNDFGFEMTEADNYFTVDVSWSSSSDQNKKYTNQQPFSRKKILKLFYR